MKGTHAELIATERLDLVPLEVTHATEMASVLSDPALNAFIGGEPQTVDELRGRYRRLVAGSPDPATTWLNWVIRLRDTDELVGTVQATVTERGSVAEVAWVVGTAWQGRGIASEAAAALVAWLAARDVIAVVAHIHPDHVASARVAASAGLAPTDQVHDGEVRWELVARSVRGAGDRSG